MRALSVVLAACLLLVGCDRSESGPTTPSPSASASPEATDAPRPPTAAATITASATPSVEVVSPNLIDLRGPIEDVALAIAQEYTHIPASRFEFLSAEPFEALDSCLGTALPWLECEPGQFSGQRVLVQPNEWVTYEFRIDADHGLVVWVPNVIVEGRSEGISPYDQFVVSGDGPELQNTIDPGYMEGPLAAGAVVPDPRALEEGARVIGGSVGKPDTDVVLWVGVALVPD